MNITTLVVGKKMVLLSSTILMSLICLYACLHLFVFPLLRQQTINTVQLTGNVARRYLRVPQLTPREAQMLTCPAQDLQVTAWIIASHASIFSCQQGHREYQPAPRPAKYSSLHSILASHLRTIFIRLER